MALDQQTEMSAAAIDEFLASRETAVLSLARDAEPYAIPISYGFDTDHRVFYFRLVSTPDSEKRAFLTEEPSARLVVTAEDPPDYRSVIATGAIVEVPPAALTPERIEQYGETKRPLFEVWAETRENLDIQLFELDPESVTGRRIETVPDPA